jgi:hypothetical protein
MPAGTFVAVRTADCAMSPSGPVNSMASST